MACKLDTGANCGVISMQDVVKLSDKPRQECQVTLTAFFENKTTAHEKVKLILSANGRAHEELFFVVEQHVPITLSGSFAERLGLLYRVQNVHLENLYQAAQPFAEVFKGLEQLKDVEYEMKLKPGTVGVVVPARKVTVALQDKLCGRTKVKHGHHLTLRLLRCRDYNLRLNLKKCTFLLTEVRYLGHILTTQGLRVDPDRANDILAMLPPSNTSETRLKDVLGATNEDPELSNLRDYAETSWPDNKQDVPEIVRPYWANLEEIHKQDGLLFRSNKSPVHRLMGRQTRTLLPVPTSHLEPETVPSNAFHNRLKEIRKRQMTFYNRNSRNLPPLSPGQKVTTYDTRQRTWSPAVILRPADTPRSAILQTEDGREIRRTREHLREAASQPDSSRPSTEDRPTDQDINELSQELGRSTRERREPCRYPLPERL
ncbi:uncharacterized protein LOC121047334 [Ixodes scapularis]|uniref:uncharacterized protein LOC121047334 n=1 Tax=Ixodes scapularis TaxID=6945 RepID=UPI001AD68409|nr:uncharacterized protein LOC121047334 [Ixodes scapularis]